MCTQKWWSGGLLRLNLKANLGEKKLEKTYLLSKSGKWTDIVLAKYESRQNGHLKPSPPKATTWHKTFVYTKMIAVTPMDLYIDWMFCFVNDLK